MLKNKTRKLLLKDSDKFLNDRIILSTISEDLKFLKGIDDFLSSSIKEFELAQAKRVQNDISIQELSNILYQMDHPYVVYDDQVYSPWDVCKALVSENLKY